MNAPPAVPILMYHSVGGSTTQHGRFTIAASDFADHLAYLADAGYRTITAAELGAAVRRQETPPAGTVVLTFDDGYADFYTTAVPLLVEHGFTATLYMATGSVGGTADWLHDCGPTRPQMLSWSALAELNAAGLEVAAHSHTHPQLDRVPQQRVRDEVRRSRTLLEDRLGAEVRGFAYPYGFWDAAARRAVADAGFDTACAVSELACRTADDPLTLPRLTVNAGTSVSGLQRLLRSRPTTVARHFSGSKRLLSQAVRRHVPGVDV
jgi:peptidoglycan/xylan/chitin deacetylase (PgdA/CDA1 family)